MKRDDNMKKQYDLPCNIAQSLNLIGDKWTLLILHAIRVGHHTYKELQEALEGIPTNLLSKRLKDLCEDDLLKCSLYSQHPPRYQYDLTEKSNDLDDVFNAILIWGDKHLDKSYKCLKYKESNVRIAYVNDDTGELIDPKDLCVQSK